MTLLLALILEWLIGDPQSRFHPVALFGRWAQGCETHFYRDSYGAGVGAWLCAVVPCLLLLAGMHMWLGWPFDVLLVWVAIGWKSLFEHVREVLAAETVIDAREAVSKIVSRETTPMDANDARRAALESLAENASDAVLAPLFWFLLLGPLGAVAYRMMNTLDAMWGYRNPRYLSFGWCAAKVDDAVNWLPARLTAALMVLLGRQTCWQDVSKQAATHASPNAGCPEVALAYAAHVKLGGPVWRGETVDERPFYGLANARDTTAEAADDALRLVRNTLLFAACIALGVSFAF